MAASGGGVIISLLAKTLVVGGGAVDALSSATARALYALSIASRINGAKQCMLNVMLSFRIRAVAAKFLRWSSMLFEILYFLVHTPAHFERWGTHQVFESIAR